MAPPSCPLVAVVLVLTSLPVAQAGAGTYTVSSCREGATAPAVSGWTSFTDNAEALEFGNGCASAPGPYAGLFARDVALTSGFALGGDEVGWRFDAPSGTTVKAISYDRYTHIKYDEDWTVGLRVTGGPGAGQYDDCHVPVGVEECTVGAPGGGSARTLSNLAAISLAFGGWCEPLPGNSVCSVGDTNMDAVLYAATVTLEDPTPPTAAPPTGSAITSGAWTRGTTPITVSGSDAQLGTRRLLIARDNGGMLLDTHELACTTNPVPCPLGTQTHQFALDTSAMPDGEHLLVGRATDGASNVTDSTAVTIRTDNTAPAAPTATTDEAWSSSDGGVITVPIPPTDSTAPVTDVTVELCPRAGACTLVDASAEAPGTSQPVAIDALPEGVTTLRARLTDAAGNLGAYSSPVTVRRDRTAPQVTTTASSDPIPDGAPIPAPAVTAEDALSGVAAIEHEVSTDGGPYVALTSQRARTGETYCFRSRAIDQAGNTGAWTEVPGTRNGVAASGPPDPRPAPTTSTSTSTTTAPPTTTPPTSIPRPAARITVLAARRTSAGRLRLTLRGTTARADIRTVRITIRAGGRTITRTVRPRGRTWTLALSIRSRATTVTTTARVPGSGTRAHRRTTRVRAATPGNARASAAHR